MLVFQLRLLQAVSQSQFQEYVHENCTSYLSQNKSSSFNSSESEFRNLCPPWYTISEDYKSCRKGSKIFDVVTFEKRTNQTWLKKYYCMTTDVNATKRIDVLGGCLSSSLHQSIRTVTFPLPCNISELNGYMCAGLNRGGQMCGRCEKGFAPPVYSYSLVCTNCTTDYHFNWLKYIGVAFGPLTIFCLIICVFHISATSPYLHGFVFFCQIVTSSMWMRLVNGNAFDASTNTKTAIAALKAYLSILGIWNLDFFVTVYKPFCLSPNMTVVQAIALNYIIALYPLLLLITALVLVRLHSRNVRFVVTLWKPFRAVLRPFLRNLDIQASLIESFATLFFLSTMKIQSVSLDLLAPTPLYYVDGKKSEKLYLYLAGDVEMFGKEHCFYGIIAVFFIVTFLLLPALLLFLYPSRFFQRLLNKIKCNSLALKTFMDVYQGSYKNGTDNTRDYRFFSGIFFCVRFLFVASFYLINSSFFALFIGVIATVFGFTVAIVHPQRKYKHYLLDSLVLMLLSLLLFTMIGDSLQNSNSIQDHTAYLFENIALGLPIVYISGIVVYFFFVKTKILQQLKNCLQL